MSNAKYLGPLLCKSKFLKLDHKKHCQLQCSPFSGFPRWYFTKSVSPPYINAPFKNGVRVWEETIYLCIKI